jgi:riboflavin synthase
MFTGLIEEIGSIKALQQDGTNLHIQISSNRCLEDLKIGDSISVDGACQTVTRIDVDSFWVTAIEETLKLVNFQDYKLGTRVNLERCLRLSDRLGGHIVQGHVDGIGRLEKIENRDGSFELFISVPQALTKYIIHKGSIAINGISLTVAEIKNELVKVCIIPKTWDLTNLSSLEIGSAINVEVDLLAKYIEKLRLT